MLCPAKDPAAAGVDAFGKAEPITSLLVESISTQSTEEHIVRAFVLGVQLEPIALEALDSNDLAFDGTLLLRPYWEPKDCKSTVLLPEFGYPPVHTLVGFGKAALSGFGGTYAVQWRRRNNTTLDKASIIDTVAKQVGAIVPEATVDLRNPEAAVCVEVIAATGLVSVLPRWRELLQYNLRACAAAKAESVPGSESVAARAAPD